MFYIIFQGFLIFIWWQDVNQNKFIFHFYRNFEVFFTTSIFSNNTLFPKESLLLGAFFSLKIVEWYIGPYFSQSQLGLLVKNWPITAQDLQNFCFTTIRCLCLDCVCKKDRGKYYKIWNNGIMGSRKHSIVNYKRVLSCVILKTIIKSWLLVQTGCVITFQIYSLKGVIYFKKLRMYLNLDPLVN